MLHFHFYSDQDISFFFSLPNSMLDIISPTKDWICAPIPPATPSVEARSLNHWTSREVSSFFRYTYIHMYVPVFLQLTSNAVIAEGWKVAF